MEFVDMNTIHIDLDHWPHLHKKATPPWYSIKSVLPKAAQHEKREVIWQHSSKGNKIINKSVLPKAAQHWKKKRS
jgi:hypothetical protein